MGDKPLFHWVLETLQNCSSIDRVIIYCSDSSIKNDLPTGIEFLKRSRSLDRSATKGAEIYDSFISSIDSDYYLLVHTTSPFLRLDTIENAVRRVKSREFDSAFPVKVIKNFCWYQNRPINYKASDIPRTQDLEPVFEETSGFFLFSKKLWKEERRRIGHNPLIVKLNEVEAVDIDTEIQFAFAETIFNEGLYL